MHYLSLFAYSIANFDYSEWERDVIRNEIFILCLV